MKKDLFKILFVTAAMIIVAPVSAITVTDLFGDIDGFGTGVGDGDILGFGSVVTEFDDEGFTDRWVFGDQSWSHIYDLSNFADVTSASISIFSGGQGLGTVRSELYIDGVLAGELTDGQISIFSLARLDVFDLAAYASLLDGSNTMEIRTNYGIDAWVLDYSEITITGTEALPPPPPQAPVPEPATLSLLGMGLAGLVARSRRNKKEA